MLLICNSITSNVIFSLVLHHLDVQTLGELINLFPTSFLKFSLNLQCQRRIKSDLIKMYTILIVPEWVNAEGIFSLAAEHKTKLQIRCRPLRTEMRGFKKKIEELVKSWKSLPLKDVQI